MSLVLLSGGKSLNAYKLGGILSSWKEHYLNSYSLSTRDISSASLLLVSACNVLLLLTSLVQADGVCR